MLLFKCPNEANVCTWQKPLVITTGNLAPVWNQIPHLKSNIGLVHTYHHPAEPYRNHPEAQDTHDYKYVNLVRENLYKGCQHNSELTNRLGLLVHWNLNPTCCSFASHFIALPSKWMLKSISNPSRTTHKSCHNHSLARLYLNSTMP